LAEPEALPDPTPAQLAEAARIDAGQVEGASSASGVVEGEASSTEGGSGMFPREYVEQLRRENADRRKRAEELEGRNARLVAGLLRAEVVADGRLADPADLLDTTDATGLLDGDGAPDPEKVKAAVTDLLGRKPHYAKRISGDVGQGARPGPADPTRSCGGSSSPGRASLRRDHRGGSGIPMIGLPAIGNGYNWGVHWTADSGPR
jgi:hypothetical protein